MFLENLKSEDFDLVRYSTVVSINSIPERNVFEKNMLILMSNAPEKKKNMLERCIIKSQEAGKRLSLQEFRTIVRCVLKTDITDDEKKNHYDNQPLHLWLETHE